jgi:hypothetical protein
VRGVGLAHQVKSSVCDRGWVYAIEMCATLLLAASTSTSLPPSFSLSLSLSLIHPSSTPASPTMSSSGRSGPVTHFFIASGTAAGAILHGLTFTTNQLDDTLHHLHRVDTRLWLAKQYTSLPLNAEDLAMLLGFSYVLFGLLTLVPSTYPPSQGGAGSRGEQASTRTPRRGRLEAAHRHRVPPDERAMRWVGWCY